MWLALHGLWNNSIDWLDSLVLSDWMLLFVCVSWLVGFCVATSAIRASLYKNEFKSRLQLIAVILLALFFGWTLPIFFFASCFQRKERR